ncbi:MAG: alanine--tRNA ligase [Aureispira sp.]|nr:alanine--tRNA ligase [Aureispira sp.]
MTVKEIRQKFLDFFESKGHKIVPAAPIVNKNDPTLMFINSGMAQFKDAFLGNQKAVAPRVADTQKCLRVSGKHNDLEDVGRDSYHQTMFEMLGNWSFGDYFKKEAIDWAWELLTEVYGLEKDRIYITVFGGDEKDGVPADLEAEEMWKEWTTPDRILHFDKKDNFWEMGDQGPCGPCSEIHIDMRSDEERAKIDGASLVNMDDPQVIEIWNLVFMQFNRKADGSLVPLKDKHIDTGMGLERLCMVLQKKSSSYETDVFSPIIEFLENASNKKYGNSYEPEAMADMAMRVIADHVRAVALVIADGQSPSNTGAGYVVRRVLRRAVRYYYSFLDIHEPLIYKLIPLLSNMFEGVFPEVKAQEVFITKMIKSEEETFLRTLSRGLKLFEGLQVNNSMVNGKDAFKLYDTYGFPFDLTLLLAEEKGWKVDEAGFKAAMQKQKDDAKKDAAKETADWVELLSDPSVEFVGYDNLEAKAQVVKYRKVVVKKKEQYQLVLNRTPFYPEGGGQVGDTGLLWFGEEKVAVINTQKENDLIIHWVKKLPSQMDVEVRAEVNTPKRKLTENNHSATHLLHAALREVLGTHVQQKGSSVTADSLRFDFSHDSKMTPEEIEKVEAIVNAKIRQNIPLKEDRSIAIDKAQEAGAMMLFGEKYGESVRMITFDSGYSIELCGGCHVPATGVIGLFKITVETSIGTGIRRVEALTAKAAEDYVRKELNTLTTVRELLKNPKDLGKAVEQLQENNKQLQKQVELMHQLQAKLAKGDLKDQVVQIGELNFIGAKVDIDSKDAVKQLGHELCQEFSNLVFVAGSVTNGKPMLTVYMQQETSKTFGLNAGKIIKGIAKEIKGGGGGQPFYATAGGKDASGLDRAIAMAKDLIKETLV